MPLCRSQYESPGLLPIVYSGGIHAHGVKTHQASCSPDQALHGEELTGPPLVDLLSRVKLSFILY